MLAHTLHNVHEHHENYKHLQNSQWNVRNWKILLLFAFIGPCSWITTYIGVISKENGYMSTAMG